MTEYFRGLQKKLFWERRMAPPLLKQAGESTMLVQAEHPYFLLRCLYRSNAVPCDARRNAKSRSVTCFYKDLEQKPRLCRFPDSCDGYKRQTRVFCPLLKR